MGSGPARPSRRKPALAGRIVIRDRKRSGLRELLIAEREHRLPGSPPPGPWDTAEYDQLLADLRAGDDVVVSSALLMKAHMHAVLPHREYAYGGAMWGRTFTLNAAGGLQPLDT